MQNEIIIREANRVDFNSIYEFVNELEQTNFDVDQQRNVYERNIKNSDFIYLVAEIEQRSIGFVSCHSQELLHHGGQKIAEIQEMYIKPENRKIGVGKMLIDKLKIVVKQLGIEQLEVTSNKRRTETHRFYKREKFINSHEKFVLNLNMK